MIILSNKQFSKNLIAVSFDTVTYRDLEHFLNENNHEGYHLSRIDPNDFLKTSYYNNGYYINLVTRDMQLRELITETLDTNNIQRFSLVHDMSYTSAANIGPGCMIYPMVSMYTNATLTKDIIVHSSTMIAHDCYLNSGCYVSAGVNIAGTTKIGKFCQFGLASIVADNIQLTDYVTVGMGTMIRKSIAESGVYVNKNGTLTKLK